MEATLKGTPTTWPRDRNCKIAVPALEHVFKQLLEVNRSMKAYRKKVGGHHHPCRRPVRSALRALGRSSRGSLKTALGACVF
jgi:hypothetical protein